MDVGNPEDVIQGLQPHANVRELSINGYRGKILFVHEFPSLESLKLFDMPKLEWFSGNSEEVIRFPRLTKLEIDECPELKSLPTSSLPLLGTLKLSDCNLLILGSLDNLTRLSFLEISSFTHFPKEMLQRVPALETLHIKDYHGLQSLPEFRSSSLKYLAIRYCLDLTNVSHVLRGQTTLQELKIFGCPKAEISAVEYHHLKALQVLRIKDIHDLESLPDGLRHLSSNLRELRIHNWSALISLPDWIETFTNLQSLQLVNCENLKSLPNRLQHLTNLQGLSIWGCHPELHGRCNKESGEYWPMIAHIPRINNDPDFF